MATRYGGQARRYGPRMRITVELPPELVEKVEHLAGQRRESRTATLEHILRTWFERTEADA